MLPFLSKEPEKPVSKTLLDIIDKHTTKGKVPDSVYTSETHTGETEYSKYDINSFADDDRQDSRAMQQTSVEAWGNILAGFAGKTATRTLDGIGFLPAAAYSLTKGLMNGDVNDVSSATASIFDNPVSQLMRQGEEWISKEFPVYQTKRQEKSYSPFNLAFANSVMDGVSYVASMYAGGNAIRALNKFGAKQLGKVFGTAAIEGKDMAYVGSTFDDAAKAAQELQRIDGGLKKVGSAISNNYLDYWGGLVESGAEASETRKTVYDDLVAEMKANNNGEPLTEDQLELAKTRSEEAGAMNFGVNMITTTLANKLLFGKMFNTKWADDMVARNKVARIGDDYVVKDASSKVNKYLGMLKGETAMGIVTEAAQEGTQFASNDFFVNLFKNPSPDSVLTMDNVAEALGNTMGDMGSKEAVHSMLIGGLIGGGAGAIFNRGKDQKVLANTQKYVGQANSAKTADIIKGVAKSIDLSNAMDGAVISGDRVTYETLKNNQVFDWAFSRQQLGKSADIKADLKAAREMDINAFKDTYDIEDTNYTEEKRAAYVDYLERVADDTVKSSSAIMNSYGHKIAALAQEAPDMLKYLTMVDVHKKDYTRRETELLTKLHPYMAYEDLAKNVLTDDKLKELQTQITEVEAEFKAASDMPANDEASMEEKSRKMKAAVNQISDLQNIIASSVTEANYLDMMKIDGLDELKKKKADDKTLYQEYSKDLRDLKSIQKAKEQTINYYNKIVNNTDYAKEVQKQINMANQSEVIKNMFTINMDVVDVNKTRTLRDGTEEAYTEKGFEEVSGKEGFVRDYVKPGDIYSLDREYTTKDKDGKYENFKRFMPFEVKGTRVDMQGKVPVGIVELEGGDGRKTEMSMNEFRRSLRPIQGGGEYKDYKYKLPKEEERFYQLYKNNAIKYQLPNGTVVIGMLGFNSYEKGLVIKYVNEDGDIKAPKFRPTAYRSGEGGYLEILDKDATTAYKLKDGTRLFIGDLTRQLQGKAKAKDTTDKLIEKLGKRINDLSDTQKDTKSIIESMIKQYTKFADQLEDEIEIKKAALDRLTALAAIPFEVGEQYPDEINEAITAIKEFKQAEFELSMQSTGTSPKQLKNEQIAKAMVLELDGNEATRKEVRAAIRELKQGYINEVKSLLGQDGSPEAKQQLNFITDAALNPRLDDQFIGAAQVAESRGMVTSTPSSALTGLSEALIEKIETSLATHKAIQQDYIDKVLGVLGDVDTLRDKYSQFKYAEYEAITRFGQLINSTGYWPRREMSKNRTVSQTTYDVLDNENGVTESRPAFVLKSTTGNGSNPHKQAFENVIYNLNPSEIGGRVIPESEYGKYQLDPNGATVNGELIVDPIYIAITDKSGNDIQVNGMGGTLTPITTLPRLTLTDSYGAKFRDAENVPNIDQIHQMFNGVEGLAIGDNYTEEIDKVAAVLASNPAYTPEDLVYISAASEHLKDLYNLRETIKGTGGIIDLEVTGKSNGVAELGADNHSRYLTDTGEFFIATEETTYIGNTIFNTTPGRAYFRDDSKQLFFPIVVDRLGTAKFDYGKETKTFVDNIIDGGKYVEAAFNGKAFVTAGQGVRKKVLLSDALTEVNNYMSYFVYQNRNDAKPDSVFTFDMTSNGVVFRVGKESFSLATQEQEIKEALSKRIFNIDKKSLAAEKNDNKTRWLALFKVKGDEVHMTYKQEVKYSDLIRRAFGPKTNIKSFKSGYVTFSGKVTPRVVAAPSASVSSIPDFDPDDPTAGAVAGGVAGSTVPTTIITQPTAPAAASAPSKNSNQPVGLAGRIKPPPPNLAPPALSTNSALAKPKPAAPGNIPPPPKFKTRPLLYDYYKGDRTKVMSPRQLEKARKMFREKYDVSFTLVKGLIDNDAYGQVTEAARVLLSDTAPVGTDRHEEFHLVSQHILTRPQLAELYNEKRTQVGNETDTDDQLEEKLATDYDLFTAGYEGIVGKIREIFDAMVRTMRGLLGIKPRIRDVYNAIYRGKYYGRPVYKGTTSYKMKKYTGDVRNDLELIPENERLKAYKAATSNFVIEMREALAASLPISDIETMLRNQGSLSAEDENRLAIEDQDRQKKALVRMITNSEERRKIVNQVNEDNESNFASFANNALYSYIAYAEDPIAAKFRTLLDPNRPDGYGLYYEAVNEFVTVVQKELNISLPEAEEVDEYETDKGVVKKGDNEIDFFQESQTQMKLLAYTQKMDDGVYPINVATLTKIYFENLSNKLSDDDFFSTLRTLGNDSRVANTYGGAYQRAVDGVAELAGLFKAENSSNEIYLQQLLYGIFSKQDVSYQVMKVVDNDEGGLRYYFVDQSKEKNIEQVKKEFISGLRINYEDVKANELLKQFRIATATLKNNKKDAEALKVKRLVGDTVKNYIFQELTGKVLTPEIRGRYKNIDDILTHFAMHNGDAQSYIRDNNSNVNRLVEIIMEGSQTKIFSITNARKNPQFSLQSPASVHYALQTYHDNLSQDEAKHIRLGKFLNLNGTQYTAKDGKGSQETKYAAASELLESDLLALYYNSIMNENSPMIPYLFNGDKSSIGGFSLSGDFLDKGTTGILVHQEMQRKIFRKEIDELALIHKLEGNDKLDYVAKQLPFYSFLKERNPKLYQSILDDVEKASRDLDTDIANDNIISKYENMVIEEAVGYFDNKATQIGEKFNQVGFMVDEIGIEDLRYFSRAFALANYEQTKLTGSLNYYKDPAKRLYAWTSAKASINTSGKFIDWYNQQYHDGKKVITSTFKSLVVQDVPDVTDWKGNNPSDAQAWVTLDTARFMLLGSGKYNQQIDDLFYAIEQTDAIPNMTAQDIKDLNEYTAQLGEQLNVLKPQSFSNQEIGGLNVPTFYKFSVFPITKTMAKGKNMQKMLETMEKNNINILMVDSANKVGWRKGAEPVKLYDENGNYALPVEGLEDRVQATPWKGLGLQVDMPNRHSTVIAGTQARKLITENLDHLPDGTYMINGEPMSAKAVRDYHETLIKAKMDADITELAAKLGIGKDLVISPEQLPSVKNEILRLANISATTSFGLIQDINDLGSFDFSTNKAKLQTILNSLLAKNVIKQKVNGDAKAMVSSVGFEKAGDTIKKDNRLKFYEDADGERHMEVYLPYSQMQEYEEFVTYDKQLRLFVFKEPKEGQEALYDRMKSIIGYRIPTQAQASIENIKIKGFMPAAYGNAVVVPFEVTSKAGSDFDIDKLNLYMPLFTKGVYNEEHIDNKLLNFYTQLMSTPAYYPLFVKSIDGKNIQRVATDIENTKVAAGKMASKGDNTNYYNFFDPLFLAARRFSFISAKDTLGAAALATTHHAESQKHGLAWNESMLLGNMYVGNRLATNTLGELLGKFASGIVKDNKIRFDRVFMIDDNGNDTKEYISDKLSEFVNAFVDAAKNDYITSANVDLNTIGVAMMLTRAGINEEKVLNFLSQPGVVEYTRHMRELKTKTRISKTRDDIKEMFQGGSAYRAPVDVKSMKNTLTDDAYSDEQKNYVNLYQELNTYAELLSELQQVTTFDTKATSKMLEMNELNLMKFGRYETNSSKYWTGWTSMTTPSSSFQASMREIAEKSDVFASNFFLIKHLYNGDLKRKGRSIVNSQLESHIRGIQNKPFASTDDQVYKIGRVTNFFTTWLAQKQAAKMLPGGEKEFAGKVPLAIGQLLNYKGQNPFVKGLRVIDRRIYSHASASLSADELNERQAAFQELMYEDLDFAKNLVYAGLATHGFVNNPFNYMNQIPGSTILDVIGVHDKDSPLITIYQSLKPEEISRGITTAINFAEKGYNEVISNYTLDTVASASKLLEEPYKCK